LKIPLLDLKAQYRQIASEIESAVLGVFSEQAFILGKSVADFESELARYVGCDHAIGVSSGTDALLMALQALGIGAGDEVITTPFTFFATVGTIIRSGAKPVFVDINPETYLMDLDQVDSRLSSKTKAIMPVHLFGRCVAVDALQEVAPGIPIIEDAAQALGAEYQGRRAGGLGKIGCFSFFPSKNLGAAGDGGAVTTQDPNLAEALRELRVHGQRKGQRYLHFSAGGNFRLDALQATVLSVKLPYLETWTAARRNNAQRYRKYFADLSADLDQGIQLPPVDNEHSRDVYNQFVIQVDNRDALQKHLADQGISTAIYYPMGLHQQPCLGELGHDQGDFPQTESVAKRCLALPIFPELAEDALAKVVEEIDGFFRRPSSA
jgi:dTDP-4-amino-4,6-dideoxygalactose transaminase